MALKADREVIQVAYPYPTCNVAAEAGQVLVQTIVSGKASGQGINAQAPVATLANAGPASGAVVAGVLLTDVQDIDQTVVHRNYQKVTQVKNEPVALLVKGGLWTNRYTTSPVPAPGSGAYLGLSGNMAMTQISGVPAVGTFRTSPEGGYVYVSVNITQ